MGRGWDESVDCIFFFRDVLRGCVDHLLKNIEPVSLGCSLTFATRACLVVGDKACWGSNFEGEGEG